MSDNILSHHNLSLDLSHEIMRKLLKGSKFFNKGVRVNRLKIFSCILRILADETGTLGKSKE